MNLPEIGDIITTKKALKLCRYFSLDYLIERIESDPEQLKLMKMSQKMSLKIANLFLSEPLM